MLFRFIGILQFDHPHQKVIQYTLRFNIIGSLGAFMLSTLWFFCFEANTFFEKTESFYAFSTAVSYLIIYCILLWRGNEILELIAKIESRIHECMSMSIHKQYKHIVAILSLKIWILWLKNLGEQYWMIGYYNLTIKKIEKRTIKIKCLVLRFGIPCFALPLMFFSYFKYYLLDASKESFYLIFPAS